MERKWSEEDFAAAGEGQLPMGPVSNDWSFGNLEEAFAQSDLILDEAIRHINHYSSQHTEAIITSDLAAAREFARRVDSSAVIINASTRFNDGGEFGLGAEIGISTDKFHARGPCGLKELTSYKYVVYGSGQVRE